MKISVFRRSAAATCPFLLVLLLACVLFYGTSAASSSSSSPLGLCIRQAQACGEEDECASCLMSVSEDNWSAACQADFSVEAATSENCEALGSANCCRLDPDTLSTCMQNPLMVKYWTCLLKADGCAIEEDMACYGVTDEEGSEAELEKAMGAGGVVATSGLILVGALGATLAALLKFK